MPAITLSPEEARTLLLSGARPPEHMIVTGSLVLSNLEFDERERMAALPDRFEVQGDLTLSSITGLTLFSRHLRVAGHAEIEQCQNFWSLGESIEADRLTVDWCSPRLASLPERTVVHRELTMRICPMLESLPDGLNLDSLTVSGAPKLTALPEDLRVRSNLRLAHCPITELPATAATLEGSLMLYFCRRLKRLPEALNVKNLSMRSLKALRQLPQVLTIGEDLLIRACPHIRQLPDNLHVPGYLDLTQHNTLEALPQNLRVGGSLWLVGCHKVESIGAGLTVGGDLRIENCRKIESIGAGLTVGERLISSDCPELSLAEFTADTEVAGDWFWWGRRMAGPPAPAAPAAVQAVAEPEFM